MTVGFCSAETFNFDFTQSNPWAAVDGQSAYSLQYSPGYSITLNALPSGKTLDQTSAGIGIGPLQPDEIQNGEFLQVSFTPPATLNSATVDKLYLTWLDNDQGAYQVNGKGNWITFNGNSSGTLTLDIGSEVESITFRANPVGILSPSDYALKGMQVSVPDGGVTLMLLGGALVGLATLRRKFNA